MSTSAEREGAKKEGSKREGAEREDAESDSSDERGAGTESGGKLPHVSGKALAEAIGVSQAAISSAVNEGRPCQDYPVHEWARRREGSRFILGYQVPMGVRAKLGLSPFDEGSPLDESFPFEESSPLEKEGEGPGPEALQKVTDTLVTALAARVAREIAKEMGPWLRAALLRRLREGEWMEGECPSDAGKEERSSGEAGSKFSMGARGQLEETDQIEEAASGLLEDLLDESIFENIDLEGAFPEGKGLAGRRPEGPASEGRSPEDRLPET